VSLPATPAISKHSNSTLGGNVGTLTAGADSYEGEALRNSEGWGLTRERVIGAHNEFLRALVDSALAEGKATAKERRDPDAGAALLGVGPGMVEAFLHEESEGI
jgi:hypothetical protein